MMSVV